MQAVDEGLNRLVKMANDIAVNNAHADSIDAEAQLIANHIRRFWPRAMKDDIARYVRSGGRELLPSAQRAVELLADGSAVRR